MNDFSCLTVYSFYIYRERMFRYYGMQFYFYLLVTIKKTEIYQRLVLEKISLFLKQICNVFKLEEKVYINIYLLNKFYTSGVMQLVG